MSGARARILARIREANGGAPPVGDPLASRLADQPRHVRPALDGDSRALFLARLASPTLTASGESIAGWADVPGAIDTYLARHALAPRIAAVPDPRLDGLSWGRIVRHDAIGRDEPVSLGIAEAAIAETGSLVFCSGPSSPTLFSYLALHHLAIVEARMLLRHMEDWWAHLRTRSTPPRNVNFVTGTSGTADIEAMLVRGAHGPRFLHVLIVG
ncbi:MAG: hypothetical protein FJX67_11845 [Alphaproteobacteria bacterium]|nr:hypothetical protein [Alphaproteobacteria bacterium]